MTGLTGGVVAAEPCPKRRANPCSVHSGALRDTPDESAMIDNVT